MSDDLRAQIALAAETAGLKKDFDLAKQIAGDGFGSMVNSANTAKAVFGALGAALSVGAFTALIKGAIDGQAALHDLSQTTGLSVAALGQFKSVGAYTETSLESITGASIKLSKAMSLQDEESKGAATAIKALGIDFDSFKKLNPEQQMLAVSKAMGEFADGADKTAAATLLFGKEGAKLLPFLADLGDAADKITTKLTDQEIETRRVQAAMSDAFGDNLIAIRKSSDGWQKELANGLLPALFEASEVIKGMVGGTGGLKDQVAALAKDGTLAEWARGAMTAFSYLLDVGQGLFSLLPMLGKLIAGVAAGTSTLFGGIFEALGKLKSGDVTGAWDSLKGGFAGVAEVANQTGEDIGRIWGQELLGQKFRDRMDDMKGMQVEAKETKKQLDLQAVLKANELAKQRDAEATKRAAEETKKLIAAWEAAEKAGEDLMRSITLKNAELQREIDLGRELSPLEQQLAKFESDLAAGKVIMSEADIAATREALKFGDALRQEKQWLDETTKANAAALDAQDKNTESVRQAVAKQQESNAVLGLSAEALHVHEQALLNDKIAALYAKAANEELANVDMATKLRAEAAEWEKLRDLKAQAFDAKVAQDFLANAQHTFEGVAGGFADAMMGGVDSIKKYLKTQLENMLIRVPLQMVAQGLAGDATNALAQAFGISQPGGAKPGIGDLFKSGKDIYNLFAGAGGGGTILGGVGGNLLTGGAGLDVGAGLGIEGLGSSFGAAEFGLGADIFGGGAAGAELLGGTAAAGGAGVMSTIAAAAPYVAAAVALYTLVKKFGGSTPHMGGYVMANADGSISDITGAQGGRQQAETQTAVGALSGTLVGLLNETSRNFGGSGGYSARGVFESDNNDPSWALFHLIKDNQRVGGFDALGTLDKDPTKGFAQFSAMAASSVRDALKGMDLPAWAADVLDSLGKDPTVEGLAKSLQQINATKAALRGMVDIVRPLGGVFGKLGGLSSDAQMQLAKFTGGIESFLQKTSSYVQNYFTDEEQAAIQAQSIMRTLTGVGLDGNSLKEKGDLRRLMDSIDPGNEQGRQQIAALLNINADFATLSKYLETSGMTLAGLAALQPGTVSVLEKLTQTSATDTAATETATAAKDTATSTKEVATSSKETASSVSTLVAQNATALPTILEVLQQLLARVTEIESTMEREAGRPVGA